MDPQTIEVERKIYLAQSMIQNVIQRDHDFMILWLFEGDILYCPKIECATRTVLLIVHVTHLQLN